MNRINRDSPSYGSPLNEDQIKKLLKAPMSLEVAYNLFHDLIGREYNDPGTEEFNFKDRGSFICHDIVVVKNIPHIIRRPASPIDSEPIADLLVDIRDVLYDMDPDHVAHMTEEDRFSRKRTFRNFQKVMRKLGPKQPTYPSSAVLASAGKIINGHFLSTMPEDNVG